MLFNSFDFLVFFIIFYIVFFLTQGTLRHVVLLLGSCIFYAWFIPKYLLILFVTIGIDYYAAIKIENATTDKERRLSLLLAIINTCAVLFVFKYYNFFIGNLNWISDAHIPYWNIILPIGLSFHTFQSLSYVIDVYRKKISAERNLLIYANYVMMFPQLIAGPIERGGHLLPQLHSASTRPPEYENFMVGAMLFFYGLFKKIVVADSISFYVDSVYNNYTHHTSMTLLVATLLFSIQIYADFSGYSDMAIGIARMLGIRFNDNFKTPYFAKSITEFWQRWHISLSSWLRDYLYYPLVLTWGKITKTKLCISAVITFALIGLWHGANWTYVIFGMIHGIYTGIEILLSQARKRLDDFLNIYILRHIYSVLQIALVFFLVSFSFIFFRSQNIEQAFYIVRKIGEGIKLSQINFLDTTGFATILFSIAILFICERFFFENYTIEKIYTRKYGVLLSSLTIVSSIVLILAFGQLDGASFIYFQF